MAMAAAAYKPPRVTVVIPAYNREKYIGAAIESILRQTFSDFELLLVDDGSTDGTRNVARSYSDPRLRLVCHERNLGIAGARNAGIRFACGEYVAFLDSDDLAHETRLARQVSFLDRHPDYAGVGAWVDWMDEDGRRLQRIKRRPVSARRIAALRLFRQGVENSASMARTAILRDYAHREDYQVCSDYDLWARIAARHRLTNLPEVLVCRRVHSQQTTREKSDRIELTRQSIYAEQLSELGVAFTPSDLTQHSRLRGMQKKDFSPDNAYLEWAERWLMLLYAANQERKCYPEPEFSLLLGEFWFKACWHAHANLGWASWRRFARSPMRGWAISELWRRCLPARTTDAA
jgi:glycosyltransferase involved in cell wall biosynthesis